MAKIKVSELAQLRESYVNEYTSLLAVDNNQSYQLRYSFLSTNLSSNLYRPIAETVSAECDIQQQKDDIEALSATSRNLCAEIQLSTQTLASEIDNKIDKTTIATSTNLGLIKVGYDTDLTAKNYAVQLTEEKAYVHVPWESGSGGSDLAEDVLKLKSISSYYAGPETNPTNKVENLSIDFTKISSYVNELSDMNIADRVDSCDERLDEILTFDDSGEMLSGFIIDLSSNISNLYPKVENLSTDFTKISSYVKELSDTNIVDSVENCSKRLDQILTFDDSGEMLSGFIVDLSSNISNLYPVGSVYTTTNNDVPDELKTNGMKWEQINTDLSSIGIRFFTRVQ